MHNKLYLWFMFAATAVVTAWRTIALPSVAGNGVVLTQVHYPLLMLMAAVTVLSLLLARRHRAPTAHVSGFSQLVGAAFGVVLAAVSAWDIVRFIWHNEVPAPLDVTVSAADRVLLLVSMLAGFYGGLFLAVWFIRKYMSPNHPFNRASRKALLYGGWVTSALLVMLSFKAFQESVRTLDANGVSAVGMQRVTVVLPLLIAVAVSVALAVVCKRAAKHHTFSEKWLWLLLPLWALARLARYNVVYASSVDISSAVYEFFLYALAALFLLESARFFSDMKNNPGYLCGLAAATAVVCVSACVSRLLLFALGAHAAVMYCPIPSVIEAALGLYAAAVATGVCPVALVDSKQ